MCVLDTSIYLGMLQRKGFMDMKDLCGPAHERLPGLLEAACMSVEKQIGPHLKPWTLRHYRLMCAITLDSPDQKTLAIETGVSESAVVLFLDQLSKAGLVDRRKGDDKRRRTGTLTAKGIEALTKMNHVVMMVQSHIASEFPPSEWDLFRTMLQEIAFGRKRRFPI
jgi:DNA-binding MarR family transcriptional regulator